MSNLPCGCSINRLTRKVDRMPECRICGRISKTMVCPDCRKTKVTDETRNCSSVRYQRFWVTCPECGNDRILSYSTLYNHYTKVSGFAPLVCKKCACKLTQKDYRAGQGGKRGAPVKKRIIPGQTIELNGCILQQTESGRCKEAKKCEEKTPEKYMNCLTEIVKLGWDGFKKIGETLK